MRLTGTSLYTQRKGKQMIFIGGKIKILCCELGKEIMEIHESNVTLDDLQSNNKPIGMGSEQICKLA